MGFVPLALSVHKFINSVGADAGFAALIAVAILVLLYFAHARETSGLRAHIQALLERVSELETALARVAANQARLQPAPPPSGMRAPAVGQAQSSQTQVAAAAAGGRAPGTPVVASAASRLAALELPPGPPAGVGAPALSSATRVIPAAVAARIAAARVAVAAGGGAEPPREVDGEAAAPATALAARGAPPPSTAAGGMGSASATNGTSGQPPAAAPAPVGAAVREALGPPQPVRAAGPPSGPRQPAGRPSAPNGQGASRSAAATAGRRPASRPSSVPVETPRPRVPRALLAGLAVLLVAGVVVAAVVLSQSSGGTSHSNASASTGKRTSQHRSSGATTARVNPANVTVTILNGTTIAGLAHKVASKLVPPFREAGQPGDAADQTHTTTVVAYLPGHRADALAVARQLGLTAASVQPIDASTENVACSGASTCATDVVVTAGSDLASL